MVYRGTPSAACSRCRNRRLKCDLATPSCSACVRANQLCTGYRDTQALRFCVQNEIIIKTQRSLTKPATENRKKPSLKKGRISKERTWHQDIPSSQLPLDPQRPPPQQDETSSHQSLQTQCLQSSIHDEAICFVYSNYVCQGSTALHYSYLPELMSKDESSPVRSAMTALGLSALANIKMASRLTKIAREEYTTALGCTNRALTDPITSANDSTLAAVILLGMFEVISFNSTGSLQRWKKHIDGASKLLEWRGEAGLRTVHGLHMFRQLRPQILANNIHREMEPAPSLIHLSNVASEIASTGSQDESRHVDAMGHLSIRLCKLCATVKKGGLTDPTSILHDALALDEEYASWLDGLSSPYWSRSTVMTDSAEDELIYGPFGNYYDVYDNLFACHSLNNYRSSRLIIHEVVSACVKKLQFQCQMNGISVDSNILIAAHQNIAVAKRLAEEIYASVPYHLGTEETFAEFDVIGRPNLIQGAIGGFLLIWPLYLAANLDLYDVDQTPSAMRAWGITCLEKIGHGMGINQSLAMAFLLRRKLAVRSWVTNTESHTGARVVPLPPGSFQD